MNPERGFHRCEGRSFQFVPFRYPHQDRSFPWAATGSQFRCPQTGWRTSDGPRQRNLIWGHFTLHWIEIPGKLFCLRVASYIILFFEMFSSSVSPEFLQAFVRLQSIISGWKVKYLLIHSSRLPFLVSGPNLVFPSNACPLEVESSLHAGTWLVGSVLPKISARHKRMRFHKEPDQTKISRKTF